ncbi:MAG: thioesterase family protein [Candidatus Neomarinimicrobiota bacterium]
MYKYNHLTKVYYRDVDQMGIVYYTRYLEYFEEARTELLDSLGLTISFIENRGIQLPVIASHCDYKRGAKLEDKLVIEASIAEIPKVKLNINYYIFDKGSNKQLVTGYTRHAFTDKFGNPKRAPKFILDKIKIHF